MHNNLDFCIDIHLQYKRKRKVCEMNGKERKGMKHNIIVVRSRVLQLWAIFILLCKSKKKQKKTVKPWCWEAQFLVTENPPKQCRVSQGLPTLESGLDIAPGINVAPRTLSKTINVAPPPPHSSKKQMFFMHYLL